MKTNKLAAGALALALGLGAVTPAFAESTATPDTGKGEVIVTTEYREAETTYVKAFQAAKEAEKTLDELETIRDSKYEVYQQALDAIDNYNEELKELNNSLLSNERESQVVLGDFTGNGGVANLGNKTLVEVVEDDLTVITEGLKEEKVNLQVNKKDEYLAHVQREKEIIAAIDEFVKDGKVLNDLQNKATKALEEYQQALNEYNKQIPVVNKAKADYNTAKFAFLKAGADRSLIGAAEKYGDVSYVTEGKTDDSESKDDDTDAKEAIEAAEAALDEAKLTARGAQLLLDSYPETVKTVRDDLVKLLAEQKGIIEKLEDVLKAAKGESVALSDILFSTAYAAEGEEESDTIEELKKATKDLEENTQAIKDKLAENEEANKIANEEAENGADDDNEPADTDDKNEPADKDDKTNADVNTSDKNEEEPAEKTETKTEVKTVKKPAKNAKTGVVGVAGVAGVLAAASVAYAASKKNN